MSKYRNVRVSEDTWRKLKQMALDEGATLHAIVERELAGIGQPVRGKTQILVDSFRHGMMVPNDLTYERED